MRKYLLLIMICIFVLSLVSYADITEKVAEVAAVEGVLEVKRIDKDAWNSAPVKSPGYIEDEFKTGENSVADIEFLAGGHVGLNTNTAIKITGIRQAEDVTERSLLQKIILNTGAIWTKFTDQDKKIEFQTKSGVLAIKGTEFVMEENTESKKTEVYVLEGEVAYNTAGSVISAKAGDKITIPWEDVPVVHHYKPEELRKECENKYSELYGALKNILNFISMAQSLSGGSFIDSGSMYYGYMAAEVINDPNEAVKNYAVSEASKHVPGPFGSILGSAVRSESKKKKEPDFPVDLNPNQNTISSENLNFTWKPYKGADSYWIFVSPREDMKELYWAQQVLESKAGYPSWAKNLEEGQKYYWRVIASKGDKPLGKASQTFFCVK
ncbi:MAG: FecR family protein [Armatimonadota bacterium]